LQSAEHCPCEQEVLGHFAEMMRPEPRPLPEAASRELSALVTRHHQLIEMMTAESNRRDRAPKRTLIDARLAALEGTPDRRPYLGASGNSRAVP
jgi:hypothetical protein